MSIFQPFFIIHQVSSSVKTMAHKNLILALMVGLFMASAVVVSADCANADIDDAVGAGTEDDPYIITMYVGDTFYYNPLANLSNSKFYCTGEAVDGPNAFITLTGDPFQGYLMSGTAVAAGTFDSRLIVSWTVDKLTQTADQYIRFKVYDPSQMTTAILASMTTGSIMSAATEAANEEVYGAGIEGSANAVGINNTVGSSYVRWDWGDGSVTTTMNEACPHSYSAKGTYTVTQTAYRSTGEAYTSAQYIYTVSDNVGSQQGNDKGNDILQYVPIVVLVVGILVIFISTYIGIPYLFYGGIAATVIGAILCVMKYVLHTGPF